MDSPIPEGFTSHCKLIKYLSDLIYQSFGRFAKLNNPSLINFKILMKCFLIQNIWRRLYGTVKFSKSSPGNLLCIYKCQTNLFYSKLSTPLLVSTAHSRSVTECKQNGGAQGWHPEVNFLFCLQVKQASLAPPPLICVAANTAPST